MSIARTGSEIRHWRRLLTPILGAVLFAVDCASAVGPAGDKLADLSLEELLNATVAVSSVARRPGSVQRSPAAVTIIGQEEIRRSGATNIAELLRLVPGMNVARVDSHEWAISTRGFNDLFANKLLVMMDGRSVYTSAFSGTFWDVQDTMLEDIERIEVVRGPGASLWGANAVNGVVNILTKRAANTQGWLISSGIGNEERGFGGIRYGGKIGQLSYRVYAKYLKRDNSAIFGTGFPEALIKLDLPDVGEGSVGSGASPPGQSHDDWDMGRAGFRVDWSPPGSNLVTVQGDIYESNQHQLYQRVTPVSFSTFYEPVTDTASGGNVLARWTHTLTNSSEFILQSYYDRNERQLAVLDEHRETFDVDFQHQWGRGRHTLVWGAGYRRLEDEYRRSIEVGLDPASRTLDLLGAFVQDEIALIKDRLELTLGSRAERNDYTGSEFQPNVRLLWTPDNKTTLWSSVSRAVRTPSRAENDFRVNFPGVAKDVVAPGFPAITIGILGNRELAPERLTSYQVGYRADLTDRFSTEVSVFYNQYDALRSFALVSENLDFTQSPVEINATIGNAARGHTYGGEVIANWQVNARWRLRADYALLQISVPPVSNVNLGSLGSESAEGTNPQHEAALRSWLDLPHRFELDTTLRYVDALPAIDVPDYIELDLRLGWRVSDQVELSLVGQNLLDRAHPEFNPSFFLTQETEVQRSIHGKVTIRF